MGEQFIRRMDELITEMRDRFDLISFLAQFLDVFPNDRARHVKRSADLLAGEITLGPFQRIDDAFLHR